MATHTAVVTASIRGPLETRQVPTVAPSEGEVRVRVEWTSSTPLDLHQNDGGLLVSYPQLLGSGTAGTVVEVGPSVHRLKVGDKVSGFTWRNAKEKSHQEYVTTSEFLLGIVRTFLYSYPSPYPSLTSPRSHQISPLSKQSR